MLRPFFTRGGASACAMFLSLLATTGCEDDFDRVSEVKTVRVLGVRVARVALTPQATIDALAAKGHDVQVKAGGYGGYQAIWIDAIGDPAARVYRGASESRKDGHAVGW